MPHTTKDAVRRTAKTRAKLPHYDSVGKPAAPGAQRSATASARNKGQQGASARERAMSHVMANPKVPQAVKDALTRARSRTRR